MSVHEIKWDLNNVSRDTKLQTKVRDFNIK